MKKVIIAATFILGAGVLHAQTAVKPTPTPQGTPAAQQRTMPSPEDMAKRQTDRLNTVLKLNDKQTKDVYKANLDFGNKLTAARKTNDRAAYKQAMDDREAEYKKILTPDQYKTYEAQRMPGRMARPGGAPGAPMAPGTHPAPPAPVK